MNFVVDIHEPVCQYNPPGGYRFGPIIACGQLLISFLLQRWRASNCEGYRAETVFQNFPCYNNVWTYLIHIWGFARTPVLAFKRFSMPCLAIHFKCLTVITGALALLPLLSIQASAFVYGGPADTYSLYISLSSSSFSVFSAYYFTICHPTCCSVSQGNFSHGNSMSAGLANVNIWTGKNWIQYYAGNVATTSLLLSQNGLKSNLRASNF